MAHELKLSTVHTACTRVTRTALEADFAAMKERAQ